MRMSTVRAKQIIAMAGLAVGVASPAAAELARIDNELRSGIDFRNIDFRVCENRQSCEVGFIKLMAQRRDEERSVWEDTATLYWDPIDGIGVHGGGQNDEIDFEERVIVKFASSVQVYRIWFSDLFRSEDDVYGSGLTTQLQDYPEDAELAGVQYAMGELSLYEQIIAANDPLPEDPFNEMLDPKFAEDGDLLRRVVMDGDLVKLVIPGEDIYDRLNALEIPIGEIDKEKLDLFEGLETVQIDLTDIIADFHNAQVFAFGTHNYEQIAAILDKNTDLTSLKTSAEIMRQQVDVSNGEQVATAEFDGAIDQLVFFAPFDSSNEYSVAGIILKPLTAASLEMPERVEQ